MIQEKFTLKDWHIPFMLFELSSYSQQQASLRNRRQKELTTEMNNFFGDDNGSAAMEFFWENLKIGEE